MGFFSRNKGEPIPTLSEVEALKEQIIEMDQSQVERERKHLQEQFEMQKKIEALEAENQELKQKRVKDVEQDYRKTRRNLETERLLRERIAQLEDAQDKIPKTLRADLLKLAAKWERIHDSAGDGSFQAELMVTGYGLCEYELRKLLERHGAP